LEVRERGEGETIFNSGKLCLGGVRGMLHRPRQSNEFKAQQWEDEDMDAGKYLVSILMRRSKNPVL
jgi:hypothetical protein